MAHEYSVQIHGWLKDRITDAQKHLATADEKNNQAEKAYYAGQLAQLKEIRQYLTDRFDLNTQQYY